jgi:hypothetical protein
MKHFLCAILCVIALSIPGICQCPKNSDSLYDRQKMLESFDNTLKTSIPAYAQFSSHGFFIYDLTEPSNKYIPTQYAKAEACVDFIDKHIYHFSPIYLQISQSHIAFLNAGRLKVFENINCNNDNLEKAINYANETLKNDKQREDILTRLKNYRRYGYYITVDEYRVSCNYNKEIPENSDKLYNRRQILDQFSEIIRSSVSERLKEEFFWFFVEESRANGFFIYDLTEPANKQTSLLERVEFKNNHIYHFALIDSPFSVSNIAILEGGKLKIFRSLNCAGKGDKVEDVIDYLNEKLKTDNKRNEIIGRVKNYRSYGVYATLNGISMPQCGEVIKTGR